MKRLEDAASKGKSEHVPPPISTLEREKDE